jgi:hypothetical protein
MTTTRPTCLSARAPHTERARACDPRTFAEAVDCVAHHSADDQGRSMSVDRIAMQIGRDANYLRKACSAFDDTHPLRGDLIVPLTVATQNDAIMRYLAREAGGTFVRLPAADVSHEDVVKHTSEVVAEFSDVLREVAMAMADGAVTEDEAARVAQEGHEAIAKIAVLVKVMEHRAQATQTRRAS